MLAAASKCKIKPRTLTSLRHYYCSNCHKPYSFTTLNGIRDYPFSNCIKSIQVGVFWVLPFFHILTNSTGNRQSIATQASPSHDITHEILSQILSDMENSTVPNDKICKAYIEKLCTAGDLPVAARLIQSLRSKCIFPGLHAYQCLLEAAAEQEDIDIVCESFKGLLLASESLSSNLFLILAKALVKKDDDAFLLRFLLEVSELTFPRNATVMNRIIFAFAEHRQVDKALLIFDQLKIIKCKPDLVTYNTILGILGQCGRVDDLLQKFSCMKEHNLVPDTISYNTLINSLRKVGRLDLCIKFFKEMGEGGVEPDLQTYTPLIDSFGRSGNVEEALRLFYEMKGRRIRPSIYIYRSLISNSKKMGKLKLAIDLSKEMDACLSDLIGPTDFKRRKR